MPRLIEFPGCCTAKILTGFGESETAEYAYRPARGMSFEDMYAECEGMIEVQKRGGRVALIFATTNSDQKMGEQVLEKLGFQRTLEVSKTQHSDKTVTGWWVDVGNAEYRAKKAPKASAGWNDVAKQIAADVNAFQAPQILPNEAIGGRVWDAIADNDVVPVPQVDPAPAIFVNVHLQGIWNSLIVPEDARQKILDTLLVDGGPTFIGHLSYKREDTWAQQRTRVHSTSFMAVGNRVRIMSKALNEEGRWRNSWVPEMDALVGKIGIVKWVEDEGIAIQIDDEPAWLWHHFPSFVLRKYY